MHKKFWLAELVCWISHSQQINEVYELLAFQHLPFPLLVKNVVFITSTYSSYYKTVLVTIGSLFAFSCPFLVKMMLRSPDLYWQKSMSNLNGPWVPPAQRLHLILLPRCSLPIEQMQHGQDGKAGSWARGVTETALELFYGMKFLQAHTLASFLNPLTPGVLWFHSYQFFIFGVKKPKHFNEQTFNCFNTRFLNLLQFHFKITCCCEKAILWQLCGILIESWGLILPCLH